MSQEDFDREVEYFEKLRKEGKELEGLVPVKAHVGPDPAFSFLLQLPPEELTRISEAASVRKMHVSTFIRAACKAAMEDGSNIEQSAALVELVDQVRALAKTIDKLQGKTRKDDTRAVSPSSRPSVRKRRG